MNELATDAPLTKALIDGGPPALIAELKAQGEWEELAPPGYTNVTYPVEGSSPALNKALMQTLVATAKLDAQRIKQIAWNNPKTGATNTRAKPIIDALAGIYGYMYLRADSVGLKVRGLNDSRP